MAIARFKDFCIDAVEPARLGRFYAAVLALEYHDQDNGDAYLTGATPRHTIWINAVPEPKSVKHRVHLDVVARGVADVERLGATVVEVLERWTVMRDPEGGEFCVFVASEPAPTGLKDLVVDCSDPGAIAGWWHGVLGGELVHSPRGYSSVDGIEGAPFESLDFIPVPEPKTVKNRIHIDVTTDDLAVLTEAGATVVRAKDDEIRWTVMADPDGNEFCAFVAEGARE